MDIRPVANTALSQAGLPEKGPPGTEPPGPAKQVAVAKEAAPSPEQLNQAVKSINETMQSLSQDLEFSIDPESNRTIVRVIDQTTKEVLRQIPSKQALEIAKALDQAQGLLIRQKA